MTSTETASCEVVLSGTFVLDLIAKTACWWLARARPQARLTQAPYGQLLESLYDPAGPLRANRGINVLVIRPSDWLRDPEGASYALSDRSVQAADETLRALWDATADSAATWLVAVPPPAPSLTEAQGAGEWVAACSDRLIDTVRRIPVTQYIDVSAVAELYQVSSIHDDYGDRIAHLPYTDVYMAALGTWLARATCSVLSKPRKLIVLDCDNTLWSGICGELGPENVVVSEPYLRLQRFMREQRAQGKLLALCSRNNEADALAVFARQDMELPLEEITAQRIGWGSKPAAIRELAAEVGCALEAVAFVDDDPVECALVAEELPEVAVFRVPAKPEDIPAALAHEWAFDQFVVTADDRLRADRYSQESRRREAMDASADYTEFLRRCRTEIRIVPLDDLALERAAQLTVRTSQFNLTGEAFTSAGLRGFLGQGDGWSVLVRDRFGDYGTVGVALTGPRADGALPVRLLLLSCRVLNRGVEAEVIRFLAERAAESACFSLRLPYRKTTRNTPARLFLEQLSGTAISREEASLVIPVDAIVDRLPPSLASRLS